MISAFHSPASSVRDATYLGIEFIRSPKSPVPSMFGQAAAKPS